MSGADLLLPVRTPRRRRHGLTVTLAVAAVAVGMIVPGVASAVTWGLPASTLSTTATTNDGAQVAVGPDGTTTVVWSQTDPTDPSFAVIMAATRLPGQTGFGAPQLISGSDLAGTPGAYESPKIAVGPDGTTVVVWRESGSEGIYATSRAAGQPRFPTTAPQTVFLDPGFNTFSPENPEVTAAPDGSFTMVWTANSNTSATSKVMAATRLAGETSFSGVQDLSASGAYDGYYMPKVAAAPDGSVVAIWSYPVGSSYVIQTATRPAGQRAFGGAEAIAGASGIRPRIAIGPDGRVTAVWIADPGVNETIRSATRAPGAASFGAPVGVPSALVLDLQVVAAPDGETTVVWNEGYATIRSSTRASGQSTWGPAEVVASPTDPATRRVEAARVAVAQDGRATVVWLDAAGDLLTTSIFSATRMDGAAAWSSATQLDPDSGHWALTPMIAVAPDGSATAVWRSVVNPALGSSAPNNKIIKTASTDATSYTVTAATDGTGSGTVSSSPTGIDCGATCTASFPLSTPLVLTAQPAAGSSFAGWGGACSGTSSTCTVSVLGDRSVTATFTLNPAGSGQPDTAAIGRARKRTPTQVATPVSTTGAGTVTQHGTARWDGGDARTVCRSQRVVRRAAKVTLVCRLHTQARLALRRQALQLRLVTVFTARDGTRTRKVQTITLARFTPSATAVTG